MRRIAAVAACFVAFGCDGDGIEVVRGEENGPVPGCAVDPVGYPLVEGEFTGRFAFSDTATLTFPVVVEMDVANGAFGGSLSFSDSRENYHATIDGLLNPGAGISGTVKAVGSDGTAIGGQFEGAMDGRGGCGWWKNAGGQKGPWRVGSPDPDGESPPPTDLPLLTLSPRILTFYGCTATPDPIFGLHQYEFRVGNAGTGRLAGRVEVVSPFLDVVPSLDTFAIEPGQADVEARLQCTGEGEGLVLVHSNDLTPTVAVRVSSLPQSAAP